MTLSELSGEYLKEEEKLTRQIKSFTPEIHRLTGEDLYLARRRLMCLYEMRSEVRAVARKLENYYDKGVKIFWLDEAEPEYTVYDFENYRYHLGPNVQVGNVYPVMYAHAFIY